MTNPTTDPMNLPPEVEQEVEQEDWFSRGKADALMGYAKNPPETDPEQASLYDLGYGEGTIQHSLAEIMAEAK